MISYICYVILDLLFTIIAYLTNPIVVLFADEYGNLPKCLRWWQTYDNCLDIEWMISEGCIPKIFRYDFNKHYIYHLEDKSNGLIPGYVELIDPNFTTWEKIQRYFCRLAWLYRNCAYGFAYEVCGRKYDPKDNMILATNHGSKDDMHWESYIADGRNIFTATWCYYLTRPWCKWFYYRIYVGWKLKGCTTGPKSIAMLAFHFTCFRRREKE